jgi:hypothetical protein
MRTLDRTFESSLLSLHELADWPAGYSVHNDGVLRLRGTRVEELTLRWGTPLWVVDEVEFVGRVKELIRVGGTVPVFGDGPLSTLSSRWAKRYGWDVWGSPTALAHAWYHGVDPRQRLKDLRGWPQGADATTSGSRVVVDVSGLDPSLLRRSPEVAVYLSVDGFSDDAVVPALRRLSAWSRPVRALDGIAVQLGTDDTAAETSSRVRHILDVVSRYIATRRNLFVDGRLHPDPAPIVHSLARMVNERRAPDGADNAVLADVTPWLLRESSVALASVESVRMTPEGTFITLSGGLPSPWPTPTSVPLVARPVNGLGGANVHSLDSRLGVLEVPVNVTPGDVLALAGFVSAPGLCVTLRPDGTCQAIPRTGEVPAR